MHLSYYFMITSHDCVALHLGYDRQLNQLRPTSYNHLRVRDGRSWFMGCEIFLRLTLGLSWLTAPRVIAACWQATIPYQSHSRGWLRTQCRGRPRAPRWYRRQHLVLSRYIRARRRESGVENSVLPMLQVTWHPLATSLRI